MEYVLRPYQEDAAAKVDAALKAAQAAREKP